VTKFKKNVKTFLHVWLKYMIMFTNAVVCTSHKMFVIVIIY